MNNTALRAEAQSADNTHMVLANDEHETFYYEKLEQARYQNSYVKAYMTTALFSAPSTMSHYYQQEVNYDMYGGGWQEKGII